MFHLHKHKRFGGPNRQHWRLYDCLCVTVNFGCIIDSRLLWPHATYTYKPCRVVLYKAQYTSSIHFTRVTSRLNFTFFVGPFICHPSYYYLFCTCTFVGCTLTVIQSTGRPPYLRRVFLCAFLSRFPSPRAVRMRVLSRLRCFRL